MAGDRAAFERIATRYQDDMFNAASYYLGNREDALDAAQEALLKIYKGIATFRGGSSLKTWILTVTINTARSQRARARAKKRSGTVVRIDDAGPDAVGSKDRRALDLPDPETSGTPSALIERKEVKEAIERAIAELEEDSRAVIVLRDIACESYESIAASLSLPIGTVKSRVHRARLELRGKLAAWVGP